MTQVQRGQSGKVEEMLLVQNGNLIETQIQFGELNGRPKGCIADERKIRVGDRDLLQFRQFREHPADRDVLRLPAGSGENEDLRR